MLQQSFTLRITYNLKIWKIKEKQNIELPENAFRELKEGEEYQPVMSPNKVYPEVSTWSVTWGLVMVVLFRQLLLLRS